MAEVRNHHQYGMDYKRKISKKDCWMNCILTLENFIEIFLPVFECLLLTMMEVRAFVTNVKEGVTCDKS